MFLNKVIFAKMVYPLSEVLEAIIGRFNACNAQLSFERVLLCTGIVIGDKVKFMQLTALMRTLVLYTPMFTALCLFLVSASYSESLSPVCL